MKARVGEACGGPVSLLPIVVWTNAPGLGHAPRVLTKNWRAGPHSLYTSGLVTSRTFMSKGLLPKMLRSKLACDVDNILLIVWGELFNK